MSVFKKLVLIGLSVFSLLPELSSAQKADLLMIGEKAPSLEAYEWIKGKPFVDYQEGKVYLLEFGATWCKPCKAVIPHLTTLSKKYTKTLSVYGFFIQENTDSDVEYKNHIDRVKSYVADMGDNLEYNVGVDGPEGKLYSSWGMAANQRGVPHAFIVDKAGRIAWMGNPNSREIDAVLAQVINDKYDLKIAAEAHRKKLEGVISFDKLKPLLVDGNGGDNEDFMFRSMLCQWREGMGVNYNIDFIRNLDHVKDKKFDFLKRSLQLVKCSLKRLYFMAYNDRLNVCPSDPVDTVTSYGELWPEVVLEVSDSKPFAVGYKEGGKNPQGFYNYSLIVPKEKAGNKFLQSVMRRDLQSWFGYQVVIEERDMPVWHLRANRDVSELLKREPIGGYEYHGQKLKRDTDTLVSNIFYSRQDKVVINSTGIGYGIHMSVLEDVHNATRAAESNRKKPDLVDLNPTLKRYGLYLEKGTHKMRVIVIRDPKPI